jgi:hypothetical protein
VHRTACSPSTLDLFFNLLALQVEELMRGQLLMGCYAASGLPLDATGVQLQVRVRLCSHRGSMCAQSMVGYCRWPPLQAVA